MTVYLDVAGVLNFLVDALVLFGVRRLRGEAPQVKRTLASAALGGIYSAVCLVPGWQFLGRGPWPLVFLGLMGAIAFGISREALGKTGLFLLLSLTLGGLALQITRGDLGLSLLGAASLGLLTRTGRQEFSRIQLSRGGETVTLKALRDTGNQLRDPVTGEQVVLIDAKAAQTLTGLTVSQLKDPLDTLARGALPGLRLIPYRSVGKDRGLLLALRFPEALVDDRKRSTLVAFAAEGLGEGGCRALTGGNL